MNLNDGVLDDLSEAPVVDGDLVKAPGSIQENQPPITLVTGKDIVPTEGSVVPQEQLEKLPSMDVTLKIVEQGQQKVLSLKEVEAEIVGQESISRTSAQYVNASFESLFDGPVQLNEFTVANSRTNYDYVKRFMQRNIAQEQQAVVSNFQLLLDTPLNDAKHCYEQLVTSYIPALAVQYYDMRALSISIEEKVINCKNSVFPAGDKTFVNIATTDIGTMGEQSLENIEQAVMANIKTLALLLKKPVLTTFIHTVKDGGSADNSISKEFHPTYMGSTTNAKDLLSFYSKDVGNYISHLEEVCSEQIRFLNDISNSVASKMETPETTEHFLSTSMPVIQLAFAILERSMSLANQLSMFNYNAKRFLSYIAKL